MFDKTMTAATFLDEFGEAETERVCRKAHTSLVYFKQCVEGRRTFSRNLAARLEKASGGRMNKVLLVFPDLAVKGKTPSVARRKAA